MVYSAKSDDTNTISQFTRLKYIHITTNGSSTPANYQVKLTIAYEPEMQADFSDIRFNTLGNIYIDYWIESKTDSVTATVWVELPGAITDPGSDTIWMYYGNAGLSDESNGNDTFIQWHGATTTEYFDNHIVTPSNIIYEFYGKNTHATLVTTFGLKNTGNWIWTGDGFHIDVDLDRGTEIAYQGNNGAYSSISESSILSVNTDFRLKIQTDGVTTHFYRNDDEIASGLSTNHPNDVIGLMIDTHGGSFEQYWAFVHQYIANEPTPSYGTAQHQRRVPQFIN